MTESDGGAGAAPNVTESEAGLVVLTAFSEIAERYGTERCAQWIAGWFAGLDAGLALAYEARGSMEATVERDLSTLVRKDDGTRASLTQAAMVLARAIDAYAASAGSTASHLSAIAKAMQELRTILARLTAADADDGRAKRDAAQQSTPEWTNGR